MSIGWSTWANSFTINTQADSLKKRNRLRNSEKIYSFIDFFFEFYLS